jgi:hypothetical protein
MSVDSGRKAMRYASPGEVKRALKNADFPATKQELIQAAEAAGAPDHVIAALRAIPPEQYANRAEVLRSVPADPAADLSPAQRAEQRRETRHRSHPQRLSEHEREVPKPPLEEDAGSSSERHPPWKGP